MILHGDDDGKSENNNSREQESSSVTCIFQTIKRSEDATDAAKSKVVFKTFFYLDDFSVYSSPQHKGKKKKINCYMKHLMVENCRCLYSL